jgi:hypothetical protein
MVFNKDVRVEWNKQDNGSYESDEQEAQARKIGLKVDPDPVPPWDWRKTRHQR